MGPCYMPPQMVLNYIRNQHTFRHYVTIVNNSPQRCATLKPLYHGENSMQIQIAVLPIGRRRLCPLDNKGNIKDCKPVIISDQN